MVEKFSLGDLFGEPQSREAGYEEQARSVGREVPARLSINWRSPEEGGAEVFVTSSETKQVSKSVQTQLDLIVARADENHKEWSWRTFTAREARRGRRHRRSRWSRPEDEVKRAFVVSSRSFSVWGKIRDGEGKQQTVLVGKLSYEQWVELRATFLGFHVEV